MDLELRRLERALADGDRAAAEELTRRTYRQIYSAILGWCRDPTEAEDLTQEAYRKAWKSLSTFQGRARFSTWLHRIAYTTFLNHRRGLERQRPLTQGEEAELVVDEPGPAEVSRAKEREALVKTAVEALPLRFRATVLAHYWNDLSVRDLATAEGVTVVAIRKRLAKARLLIEKNLTTPDQGHKVLEPKS